MTLTGRRSVACSMIQNGLKPTVPRLYWSPRRESPPSCSSDARPVCLCQACRLSRASSWGCWQCEGHRELGMLEVWRPEGVGMLVVWRPEREWGCWQCEGHTELGMLVVWCYTPARQLRPAADTRTFVTPCKHKNIWWKIFFLCWLICLEQFASNTPPLWFYLLFQSRPQDEPI